MEVLSDTCPRFYSQAFFLYLFDTTDVISLA
jgi:hypothetical protein